MPDLEKIGSLVEDTEQEPIDKVVGKIRSDLEKEQESSDSPSRLQNEETPAEHNFDAEFTEEEKKEIEERLQKYGRRQPGTDEVVNDLRHISEKEPEKN